MTQAALYLQPGKTTTCSLSVVVPIYNEEAVLPLFHRRLAAAIARIPGGCEVIYVDDGSTDCTSALLQDLRLIDLTVGVARFTRNFGKEQAMSAGLRLARGTAVVIIDADLQDPPELIPALVEAWQEGAEVVNMRRRKREGESLLKRATAHAFYRIINKLSEVPIPEDVGDFRLLSRRAVDALNLMPERGRLAAVRGTAGQLAHRLANAPAFVVVKVDALPSLPAELRESSTGSLATANSNCCSRGHTERK